MSPGGSGTAEPKVNLTAFVFPCQKEDGLLQVMSVSATVSQTFTVICVFLLPADLVME